MQKNKKNEELQSRREFFKRAAKGALPILGAIVLANVPNVADAVNSHACDCSGGCGTGCFKGCAANCHIGCAKYCKAGAING